MKECTVCGIQIYIKPMDIEENIKKVVKWIDIAMDKYHPDLIVLPETITTGFVPNMPKKEFYEILDFIPGKHTKKIQKAANKHKVYTVLPIYEKGEKEDVIYNSSALISREGEIMGIYRKTHPFATERIGGGGWTTPGYETPVFDTDIGKIGMIICYDGDFPELCRVMALKGAEIIVRPSAFLRTFDHWNLTNSARAYDNHVYFIAVNSIGLDAGGNCYYGHSMIVSPIAQRLAQARGTEEIITATLSPDPLKYISYGSDSPQWFDHLEDRNVKAYKDILLTGKSPFEPTKRIPY